MDSNPARISDAKISWHDAKDGGNYTLDRNSGKLTVIVASSTGGYFLYDHCRLKPRLRIAAAVPRSLLRHDQITSGRQLPAVSERRDGRGLPALKASVGFSSETGPRKRNEDFVGAVFGAELPEPRREVVAAIADGIGGAKGGRVAAETAVRGFLDGFWDLPETMEVRRAAATIMNALNGWIHSQGRQDPELAGMGCTFTALVLRGRVAHLLHVGDTRAYRLRGDRLACLTTDHVREERTRPLACLYRALGDRGGAAAGLRQPSRWRCTTASCCAATACTGS